MSRQTRREFVARGAAGAAGFAVAPWWLQGAEPELIILNARIFTMDAVQPRAEALAIAGDRFMAVGSSAAIKARAAKGTRTIDAKGMTIVPGFTDTHNHAGGTTLLYEVLVGNPFEVEFVTIASIIEKLRKRAGELPPGTWVEGDFRAHNTLKQ